MVTFEKQVQVFTDRLAAVLPTSASRAASVQGRMLAVIESAAVALEGEGTKKAPAKKVGK